MRLLVSVRSAVEVPAALEGGAEIIDAKDPSRGPLGPVALPALREIARRLPDGMPLSVALGDFGKVSDVVDAIQAVDDALRRRARGYLKLGFAGTPDPSDAEALLAAAVRAAALSANCLAVIAVAYADHEAAASPAPWAIGRMAADAGADGVLVDTCLKDGQDLFAHAGETDLREWIDAVKDAGLLVALAGALTVDGVLRAASLGADVVGVRGAACDGGRNGAVVAERVRALRSAIEGSASPAASS